MNYFPTNETVPEDKDEFRLETFKSTTPATVMIDTPTLGIMKEISESGPVSKFSLHKSSAKRDKNKHSVEVVQTAAIE